MKIRNLIAMSLVLTATLSTMNGSPTPPPAPPVNLTGTLTTGPSVSQIDVVFHGHIAFLLSGKGMQSLFLSPRGAQHVPFVAIDTDAVDGTNTSVPDFLVSGQNGDGNDDKRNDDW